MTGGLRDAWLARSVAKLSCHFRDCRHRDVKLNTAPLLALSESRSSLSTRALAKALAGDGELNQFSTKLANALRTCFA
jgi:hypothetical protein